MILIRNNIQVQRFELLEERLGISIKGIKAILTEYELDRPERIFRLEVMGEVIGSNGGVIDQDIELQVIAIDSNGDVVGTGNCFYYESTFFGLDVINFKINVFTMDFQIVRVFPKKT